MFKRMITAITMAFFLSMCNNPVNNQEIEESMYTFAKIKSNKRLSINQINLRGWKYYGLDTIYLQLPTDKLPITVQVKLIDAITPQIGLKDTIMNLTINSDTTIFIERK